MKFFDDLFNKHKFARRAALFWAMYLITVVVLRVTEPEIITKITGAGATIVTAVIGMLSTVIVFYQNSRKADENGVKLNGDL